MERILVVNDVIHTEPAESVLMEIYSRSCSRLHSSLFVVLAIKKEKVFEESFFRTSSRDLFGVAVLKWA